MSSPTPVRIDADTISKIDLEVLTRLKALVDDELERRAQADVEAKFDSLGITNLEKRMVQEQVATKNLEKIRVSHERARRELNMAIDDEIMKTNKTDKEIIASVDKSRIRSGIEILRQYQQNEHYFGSSRHIGPNKMSTKMMKISRSS